MTERISDERLFRLRIQALESEVERLKVDAHGDIQGSYCPECRLLNVPVDEDGCCTRCGVDSMWYGTAELVAAVVKSERAALSGEVGQLKAELDQASDISLHDGQVIDSQRESLESLKSSVEAHQAELGELREENAKLKKLRLEPSEGFGALLERLTHLYGERILTNSGLDDAETLNEKIRQAVYRIEDHEAALRAKLAEAEKARERMERALNDPGVPNWPD